MVATERTEKPSGKRTQTQTQMVGGDRLCSIDVGVSTIFAPVASGDGEEYDTVTYMYV